MWSLPTDSELQAMSDADLEVLWSKCPAYPENPDWCRVAKEIRYRNKFRKEDERDKKNNKKRNSIKVFTSA